MGFGVHSPLLFRVIRYVIYDTNSYYVYSNIEGLRKRLLKNTNQIYINDFGTGKSSNRAISEIASKSVKSKKYGQLLFRLVHEFQPKTLVELGTSLGITSLYLATASKSNCYTFEGSQACIDIAKSNFIDLGVDNIQVFEGDINKTLKEKLQFIDGIDFAFIDAEHTYKAVITNFDLILSKVSPNAVIVVDDINWSTDMHKAWGVMKGYDCVTSTIDLFEVGILFLNPELNKKHYRIIY
jgi:predicted O-methyltransferase YrrM